MLRQILSFLKNEFYFISRMNRTIFFFPFQTTSFSFFFLSLLSVETFVYLKYSRLVFFVEEKTPIQLQISFQYDQKDFYVMIHGARYIPIQHGLFACQLSLQNERDISYESFKYLKKKKTMLLFLDQKKKNVQKLNHVHRVFVHGINVLYFLILI